MEPKKLQKDKLKIEIYEDAEKLGEAAAISVARKLNSAITEKGFANLILATGSSQFEFLTHLQKQKIDWKKITVFHLDEYMGMSISHPASFRKCLKERILDHVQPQKVYYLEGDAKDVELAVAAYESLLKNHPIDIACIGIGENGHIAFNDPLVADFNDPKLVKVVELDEACRRQQLGEGWLGGPTKAALDLGMNENEWSHSVSFSSHTSKHEYGLNWLNWFAEDINQPARWLRIRLDKINKPTDDRTIPNVISLGEVMIWGEFKGEIQATIRDGSNYRLISNGKHFKVDGS